MTEQKRLRKRKRSCDMTRAELKKLQFLNGAQAAVYCQMAPRTFYTYVEAGLITKYPRPTSSGGMKNFYNREQLEGILRPRPLMEKILLIQEQTSTSLTAKGKRS